MGTILRPHLFKGYGSKASDSADMNSHLEYVWKTMPESTQNEYKVS